MCSNSWENHRQKSPKQAFPSSTCSPSAKENSGVQLMVQTAGSLCWFNQRKVSSGVCVPVSFEQSETKEMLTEWAEEGVAGMCHEQGILRVSSGK